MFPSTPREPGVTEHKHQRSWKTAHAARVPHPYFSWRFSLDSYSAHSTFEIRLREVLEVALEWKQRNLQLKGTNKIDVLTCIENFLLLIGLKKPDVIIIVDD